MFHNYGLGEKHTSRRAPPTARQARRLEKKKAKKVKTKPLYTWEGEVICEQVIFEKPSNIVVFEKPLNITYEKLEKALEFFKRYSSPLVQR